MCNSNILIFMEGGVDGWEDHVLFKVRHTWQTEYRYGNMLGDLVFMTLTGDKIFLKHKLSYSEAYLKNNVHLQYLF